MKNKFITALFSVGLAFTLSTTVIASPLDDLNTQKNNLLQQQNQNSSQIGSLNKQIAGLESTIEGYDNQISGMTVKLNDTKHKVSDTQAKIVQAQNALKKAQDDYDAQRKLLDQRIKVIYVNGSESYVDFLLDSKGLSDFVSRIETVKQVSELDKQVMNGLEEQQQQIKAQKETLDTQKTQLVKLQSEQQSTLDSLNKQKSQEATIVAQYNAKKASLLKNDSQYRAQLAATNRAIQQEQERLEAEASKVDLSPSVVVSGNTTADQIVAYAMKFLGTPYQWGGNGPNTFDCSGFTRYVYAHFGIYLPRTSETQCNVGTRVSKSQLQKGDLVFFENSDGDVHHVGIYVGDGYYINAPHTGDVVKIAPVSSSSDYIFGARILK